MRLAVSDAEAEPGLLPSGFAIVLDPDAKPVRSGGWFGGSPGRVLRLTAGGREAWDELRAGPVRSRRSGLLARRLTDACIAHPVPPPLPGPPDVTVVIPVRDRAIELDRCLTSLARAYPVIVIDDASADERAIRRVVTAHAARVIRLDVNVGPAQARNIGTAAADTELIGYVDSDTVPGARLDQRPGRALLRPGAGRGGSAHRPDGGEDVGGQLHRCPVQPRSRLAAGARGPLRAGVLTRPPRRCWCGARRSTRSPDRVVRSMPPCRSVRTSTSSGGCTTQAGASVTTRAIRFDTRNPRPGAGCCARAGSTARPRRCSPRVIRMPFRRWCCIRGPPRVLPRSWRGVRCRRCWLFRQWVSGCAQRCAGPGTSDAHLSPTALGVGRPCRAWLRRGLVSAAT